MFSHLLLISAALLFLITAVSIALFYQSGQPQTTIYSPENYDHADDHQRLEAMVDFMMQYPLEASVELGILTSTRKTCLASPKGALHLAWQHLERQLFEMLSGHPNYEENGELSLEFLLWTDVENELPGFTLPPEIDRKLLGIMIEIDKILVRNPIMPFTSAQSEKYLKLSAHLINQLRHFKQINPI